MKRIVLATCKKEGKIVETAEERLLAARLSGLGVEAQFALWGDQSVDWGEFDLVLIRSCWDYHLRSADFRKWIEQLKTRNINLWNPPDTVLWNMNKKYLRELEEMNIFVPPTAWISDYHPGRLQQLIREHRWEKAVVKPAISASGFKTAVVNQQVTAEDEIHLKDMLSHGDVLVQQFISEVTSDGEWSVVFFGSQFSHGVIKRAKPGDFRVQDDFGGTAAVGTPPAHVLEGAKKILATLQQPILYARVDGISVGGRFMLMELELIEPVLFLNEVPEAANRFAAAIQKVM